ncbi:hypothetical protein HFZ78_18730 [Priestia megaterium]|uniref:Cysteine-rich VLP domain-containing protein n=1 Tax=Priestia megaterium TaxID=1404 RepID=A0A6H1P5D7_PRIMG|nr:hypothetical protein HFZ78_18730 [Priestia megaterium]
MTDLQRLIKNKCATYDDKGNCYLETGANSDKTCVYFREQGGRCTYAEQSVIPDDAKIEASYLAERGVKTPANFCDSCLEPFERKSNRQRYCKKCGEFAEKENRRNRDREYKERKRRFKD